MLLLADLVPSGCIVFDRSSCHQWPHPLLSGIRRHAALARLLQLVPIGHGNNINQIQRNAGLGTIHAHGMFGGSSLLAHGKTTRRFSECGIFLSSHAWGTQPDLDTVLVESVDALS